MTPAYYPTAQELMAGQNARRNLVFGLLVALALAIFGTMGATSYLLPKMGPTALIVIGVTMFVTIAIPVAVWHSPRLGLYALVAAALVFGGDPSKTMISIPTSMVPLWWNVSIIAHTYAGTNALDAIILSPGEILMILTALTWLIRHIAQRDLSIEKGVFFGPVLFYIIMVVVGFLMGISRGGDSTVALWEVRSQFQFLLAYLLGVNLFKDTRHIVPLLWVIIIFLGVQGIFGTLAYFEMGGNVTEDGIPGLDHAGSLFFNVLFLTYTLVLLAGVNKRMGQWGTLFLPLAIWATLSNQRRAGIGAFIVAFLPLIPMMWLLIEERRPQIARFALIFGILSALYLPPAWNASGAWALPARSLKSFSNPSARDAQSNYYRDAENFNLKYTRDVSPILGYGYGRPFIRAIGLPEINFPLKDFIPHNGVLWIWMRLGHVGMFAFLLMVVSVIVRGIHQLRNTRDRYLLVIGGLAISNMMQLFIYGKYDMQFGNPRAMIFTGILVGILGILPKIDQWSREEKPEAARVEFEGPDELFDAGINTSGAPYPGRPNALTD